MSEATTDNAAATNTAPSKGKTKKSATAKAAKTKTATAKTKATTAATPAKPKKEKPPRESREGWGTFALRLPIPERDAFHTAAGPANASRCARSILVAFANEDEGAFKAAIAEARKLR